MKNPSNNLLNHKDYFLSANFFKLGGVFILVTTIALIFLGFAVMFILQGLLFFLLRLSAFWEPASRLWGKLSFASSDKLNKWGWWKWIFIFLMSVPELLLVAAGVWILYTLGFERQNFIFLLFFK